MPIAMMSVAGGHKMEGRENAKKSFETCRYFIT